MSRIGKQPIPVPGGVTVELGAGRTATVKGPGGTLTMNLRPEVDLEIEAAEVNVTTNGSGSAREARSFHGLTRALLNNMVLGVTKGFEKKLDIIGVGWNAKVQGNTLVLSIGFCHPVEIAVPTGLSVETPQPTHIVIKGADKQAVGHLAAVIRGVRPPEPYKGKGIRYIDEFVRRKAGKSFGA